MHRLHQFVFVELKKCFHLPLQQQKGGIEVVLFHTDKSDLLMDVEGILPEDNLAKAFMFHVLFETTFDIQASFIKQYFIRAPSQSTGEGVSLRVPNNSNVQRLVGWAIRTLKDRLSKQLTRSGSHTKVHVKLKMLQKMSLTKAEATSDYESKYYTLEDRIFDKGGLTLVHAALFPWGIAMLSEIRKNLNHETISKHKGSALQHAWRSLTEGKELLDKFKSGVKSLDGDVSDTHLEELHEDLLRKVFNAEADFEVREFARKKLESAKGKDASQIAFRIELKGKAEAEARKRHRDESNENDRETNTSKRQKTQPN